MVRASSASTVHFLGFCTWGWPESQRTQAPVTADIRNQSVAVIKHPKARVNHCHPTPSVNSNHPRPVNRANPYPEVTDQFCRLPLPTFFYRPEAVHLGDLLRIWVRLGTRLSWHSLRFSRADESALDTARAAVLYACYDPISGWTNSRVSRAYKEKTTLPRTPADVSQFIWVTSAVHRDCSQHTSPSPSSGILTWFPFAPGYGSFTQGNFTVSCKSFHSELRADWPMFNYCSHGTLLLVGPQGSHLSICYYHQDLHHRRLHCFPRSQLQRHRRVLLTPLCIKLSCTKARV